MYRTIGWNICFGGGNFKAKHGVLVDNAQLTAMTGWRNKDLEPLTRHRRARIAHPS